MAMMIDDDVAAMDEDTPPFFTASAFPLVAATTGAAPFPSSSRPRSLSDSGSTPSKPKLSPSPHIVQSTKDDSSLDDAFSPYTGTRANIDARTTTPVTPRRSGFHPTLQLPSSFAASHSPTRDPALPIGVPPAAASVASSLGRPVVGVMTPSIQGLQRLPAPQLPSSSVGSSGATSGSTSAATMSSAVVPVPTPTLPSSPPGGKIAATAPETPTPPSSRLEHLGGHPSPHAHHPSHSLAYSPTHVLPRRSRGLDFSRAATSLHQSTLADQSSPDSSPTLTSGARARPFPSHDSSGMTIPGCTRGTGDFGASAADQSTSLWSMMGSRERMQLSSSHGSHHNNHAVAGCRDSSSSDDDDPMDEDMDDAYVGTPKAPLAAPFPALTGNLLNYQQRRRPRKLPKRRLRGPLGLGFSPSAGATVLSRSPPVAHGRRDGTTRQANQPHTSGSDSEDESGPGIEGGDNAPATPNREGQRGVIRRVVARRGNLLPKTKTFARVRAALAEEGAPAEAEFRREAEVVRLVLESDILPERRTASVPPITIPTSAAPAAPPHPPLPNPARQDHFSGGAPGGFLDDMAEIDLMTGDFGNIFCQRQQQQQQQQFQQRAIRHPRTSRLSFSSPRGTPGGDDTMSLDSSSAATANGTGTGSGSDSQQAETPRHQTPPTAAEITRRINSKRRRDEDFDPVSFKRRAVSPGVSVHNSPVTQSPMQRDSWGSRPGSKGGDGQRNGGGGGGGGGGGVCVGGPKGRVGFQGMTDTSDGLMRMSIE